jgi:hypothetical protein
MYLIKRMNSVFSSKTNLLIEELSSNAQAYIIVGGDFNVFLNTYLDCSGSKPTVIE